MAGGTYSGVWMSIAVSGGAGMWGSWIARPRAAPLIARIWEALKARAREEPSLGSHWVGRSELAIGMILHVA